MIEWNDADNVELTCGTQQQQAHARWALKQSIMEDKHCYDNNKQEDKLSEKWMRFSVLVLSSDFYSLHYYSNESPIE